MGRKHIVIPDTQCKQGVPMEHLHHIGNCIVDEKPDVIVHLGDHFDMPSLSSYDKGKRVAEGRRIHQDFDAGHQGMNVLMFPINSYNLRKEKNRKKKYNPEMHFCLGNHEERLNRHIDSHPELEGLMKWPDAFKLDKYGWKVHEFKEVVEIDGINYVHYFYNPNSGKPYGGTCHTKLKNIGHSFIQGHQQGLDMATRTTNMGVAQWGIVAGSCYLHDEAYRGPQANIHWNGILILDEVQDGNFDLRVLSLDSLRRKYGG